MAAHHDLPLSLEPEIKPDQSFGTLQVSGLPRVGGITNRIQVITAGGD
jgi:hypothetical protein